MNTTSPHGHTVQSLDAGSLDMATVAELPAGSVVDLAFPIAFGTADGAVLGTVPTGCALLVLRGFWEVTTAFSGGSSSAIGLASSQAPHTTAGDLLGGASGNVEADLTAGIKEGTVGADQAAGILLVAGATITFERITSAFTAGAGYAHLVCVVIKPS
ncbi:MAG: hypothetical protein HOW73_20550 [Polyangiaceae bacterium]|nr:hypothetical protein [Polyangiaceae bacterium]